MRSPARHWLRLIAALGTSTRPSVLVPVALTHFRADRAASTGVRRTGFVKGYALLEYESKSEAQRAISEMDGKDFLGQAVRVDWAFSAGPVKRH